MHTCIALAPWAPQNMKIQPECRAHFGFANLFAEFLSLRARHAMLATIPEAPFATPTAATDASASRWELTTLPMVHPLSRPSSSASLVRPGSSTSLSCARPRCSSASLARPRSSGTCKSVAGAAEGDEPHSAHFVVPRPASRSTTGLGSGGFVHPACAATAAPSVAPSPVVPTFLPCDCLQRSSQGLVTHKRVVPLVRWCSGGTRPAYAVRAPLDPWCATAAAQV